MYIDYIISDSYTSYDNSIYCSSFGFHTVLTATLFTHLIAFQNMFPLHRNIFLKGIKFGSLDAGRIIFFKKILKIL
jgi:hypothetical protein